MGGFQSHNSHFSRSTPIFQLCSSPSTSRRKEFGKSTPLLSQRNSKTWICRGPGRLLLPGIPSGNGNGIPGFQHKVGWKNGTKLRDRVLTRPPAESLEPLKTPGAAPSHLAETSWSSGNFIWTQLGFYLERYGIPGIAPGGFEHPSSPSFSLEVAMKTLLIPPPLQCPNSQNFMCQELPHSKSFPRASQPRLRVLGTSPEETEFLQFFSLPPAPLSLIPIPASATADVTHSTPFSFLNLRATFFNRFLRFQQFPIFKIGLN